MAEKLRYSGVLVTQGRHRFYTMTMPSDVLARTCFVISRDEDPIAGFQRLLDAKRAQAIADYIDTGLGTIPNSIVLSAQEAAGFKYVRAKKMVEFEDSPKSFLILDGQHRVYGFSMAKSPLRVPVVIYNELSRTEESRLFIDINTKQRPVPNELLLDIRKIADYQNDVETVLGEVFDFFNTDSKSPLVGLMSPSKKKANHISRVTFNAAVKPLLSVFGEPSAEEIYRVLSPYVGAIMLGAREFDEILSIENPTAFRSVMALFPDVARRVKDRHKGAYTTDNFYEVLKPMFRNLRPSSLRAAGKNAGVYTNALREAFKSRFTI